jgi:hypothetical protein
MARKVGYCGIVCSDCPVLIATRKNDDAERERVANTFTKQYGKEYKPEDINCGGCTSNSKRIFSYCSACKIRECGKERNVENCAYCSGYPCEKLTKLFSKYSKAKDTLDAIRREYGIF